MRTNVEVRFINGEQVRRDLAVPARRERVLIGLAAMSTPARALLIRDAEAVPEDAFVSEFSSSWSHRFTMAQVARATSAGMGLCIIHSHGGVGPPALSSTDVENFEALAPAIQSLHPEMLVASIVTSGDGHAAGLVVPGGGGTRCTVSCARWFGSFVEVAPQPSLPPRSWTRGKRHLPVWGEAGEARVHGASIGVVGLGGGGSHVVQQLAHISVRELVGVDADLLEDHNRSRVVGTERGDIGKKKLSAMRRIVRKASDGRTKFVGVDDVFPGPDAIAALATCDALVGCVDKLHTRKVLQEFAWQHAIPLVDIGLTIDQGSAAYRPVIGGQVFVGVPGGPCMWCARVITQAMLDDEKDENGYVRGGGEAQVVSLNGVLASQAVTEVLNLLTGFQSAQGERLPVKLVFSGRRLSPVEVTPRPGCSVCSAIGFGDVRWNRAA